MLSLYQTTEREDSQTRSSDNIMSTHEPRLTGTKTCSKCERELPVLCFSTAKDCKDGLRSECRDCVSEYVKKRQKSTKNLIALRRHYEFHNKD